MHAKVSLNRLVKLLVIQILVVTFGFSQIDSTDAFPEFNSKLLRLKVPEAFQRSSLKLEVFSDSTWQLFRGEQVLGFSEAMRILGKSEIIQEYEYHRKQEAEYFKGYRSRRVFSIVTVVGGASYLVFIWNKGWVYQIPGYSALVVAAVRYWDSRKLENMALREQYYWQSLVSPSLVQQLVDDYNFRLYQYLTRAGIQFSDN